VTWLAMGAALSIAVLTLGCEAVLGADFGDFGPRLGDADGDASSTLPDGGLSVDGWPPSRDSSANDVRAPDGHMITDDSAPLPTDGGPIGTCTPGELKAIGPCGNCGQYLQKCNDRGTWNAPFCQQEPDTCSPGWREQRQCEGNGTLTATCTDRCIWMLGSCMQSNCMPSQVEEQKCGFCGTQARTCQPVGDAGGWQWTPFSECMNQKACAPNTIERDTCGNCGTRSRRCEVSCMWSGWGVCEAEGECAAGTQETVLCALILGRMTRTCDDSCKWGAFGPCTL
jgi:hypothetical protein